MGFGDGRDSFDDGFRDAMSTGDYDHDRFWDDHDYASGVSSGYEENERYYSKSSIDDEEEKDLWDDDGDGDFDD